jgi:hypothetical protein
MKIETLKKEDIKYENIDFLNKTITIKDNKINLKEFVNKLLQENRKDLLMFLKHELIFVLRLYGMNGYEIVRFLSNLGYPRDYLY